MCVQLAGSIYDKNSDAATTVGPTNATTTTTTIPHHYTHGLFIPASIASDSNSSSCHGEHCFYETYLIIAGLMALGTFSSAWLTFRTWKKYVKAFSIGV